MKKKFLKVLLCSTLATLSLMGCNKTNTATPSATSDLNVGMVTGIGTIDDKSLNQGTWEGILQAETDLGISKNYLKPNSTSESDLLKEITNLYDAGYKFILTPGYPFATAIYAAQDKYPDAKFVAIDYVPSNGQSGDAFKSKVGENTVSIFFAEHEAGFLAGIAAAVEQKNSEVGFIGGMEAPVVQRFNWGFQQGIAYANKHLGTNIILKPENVVYQGTFDNVPAGQQLAAQMYEKGVDTIFCAAGAVGIGAITEATERAINGQDVWIIGVDNDQYQDGIYGDGKSVVLTSAVKNIKNAAFTAIQSETKNEFPGGQSLVLDIKTDSIGLPSSNPNLSEETLTVVNQIIEKLKSGEIVVSKENTGDFIN